MIMLASCCMLIMRRSVLTRCTHARSRRDSYTSFDHSVQRSHNRICSRCKFSKTVFVISFYYFLILFFFFFSSRRRHTRFDCDWSSDVCSSDLMVGLRGDQGTGEDIVLLEQLLGVLHRISADI